MASKLRHVTVTPNGFRAHLRIGGVLHQQRFPPGTEASTIKEWLYRTDKQYRRPGTKRTGRFGDDARAYLETVRAMPTFEQRRLHIEAWVEVFGESRRRSSITSDEIQRQLHAWRTVPRTYRTGTKGTKTGVLSAASVNKRRTALMHLFTVLDGKGAPNPVKEVSKMAEPEPAPRALPYSVIKRIFKAMPASRSKARLMVLAYTGIPPAQIRDIAEDDVNFAEKTVAIAGRKKGKGTKGRTVPLTDDGVKAFKMMQREDAWGPFTEPPLRRAFRRAVKMVIGREDFTPYDLRHSFGTEIYRQSGDIRATQVLLDHSTPTLTHRYVAAAVDPRVAEAIKRWKG